MVNVHYLGGGDHRDGKASQYGMDAWNGAIKVHNFGMHIYLWMGEYFVIIMAGVWNRRSTIIPHGAGGGLFLLYDTMCDRRGGCYGAGGQEIRNCTYVGFWQMELIAFITPDCTCSAR